MMPQLPEPIYLKNYLPPDFLIDKVELEFHLGEDKSTVYATLTCFRNFIHKKPSKDLVLKGEQLTLLSVAMNDIKLSSEQYALSNTSLTIFNVPDQFVLRIVTEIEPQNNTALSGLYKSSGNFCTQCEAQGFRRITYFLDRPDVMARYAVKIIADRTRYPILLSNGNLIESGLLNENKHWVKWEDPFKKPCYLFALVAGDLEWIEDEFVTRSGRHILLQIYVEKGNKDKCTHAMQAVKKAMQWDETVYQREYDLDRYMIVAVNDFNMGAMENKGLNIFNTHYILASPETATDMDYIHVESVIAHEYFHNWTGNRITCRDWFQLSLKEGLTIFRDQCFTADTTSKTVARILDVDYLRTSQFSEDASPLAHPVQPKSYIEINNFYTSTVYNKGSELIHMLRTIVGEEVFYQGMELYFSEYDGQAITIEEFIKAHEKASGLDLKQFRRWYSQVGTPEVEAIGRYQPEDKKFILKLKQNPVTILDQSPGYLHIPIKMGLMDQSGKEIVSTTLHLKEQEQQWAFDHVDDVPYVSLLRNFSAPIKLHYHYTHEELSFLIKHDADLFNRWESSQKYALNILLAMISDIQSNKPLQIPAAYLELVKHQLENLPEDRWLLAKMLTPPSEKYLAEQMEIIDVEAIHRAREFFLAEIGVYLQSVFKDLYDQHHNQNDIYQFSMKEVGKRFLKNLCLSYLVMADPAWTVPAASKQFHQALEQNMTDTIAALNIINQVACDERDEAFAYFYKTWQKDALVVDKWLGLQAICKLPGTLNTVKKLMHHEAFELKNPNKVYALIGSFTSNAVRFHAKEGDGYEFLRDVVLALDSMNPQIASRMLKPLTNWKRFDATRQNLMRVQLEEIARQGKLSKDVFELVSKSL